MKVVNKLKNIYSSIKKSIRRFPITIAISTTLVIMLIILSEKGANLSIESRKIFERVNMIIALGIPMSLCIKLIYEQKDNLKGIYKAIGYILGAIVLILYYKFLLKDLNMVSTIRYIGVSIFLYLAFSYIPWIKRKEDYEFYIIKVFSSFFLTAIYSFVLLMGVFAIFFTIDQLFNANISGKTYYYTFLIVGGIFAPSMFLAKIPETNADFSEYNYPKSLKVLLLYIVIPLISIYTTILYIYFGKIIITKNWPQGIVSHLVLWYSTVSVAVVFFISPILKENKWANRFKFWFPKLIIPILIMMFISMGIRINEYGITENRYFALVLGLWVLGIMLYFIFSKKQKNIIIPIVLSIIALNSAFGPLSSFNVSKRSQNNRLKSILTRNNMLVDNKVEAASNISIEDKEEISMILNYFNTNHSLENVKYLPEDFKINNMEEVFGFSYIEKNIYNNEYFYYYTQQERNNIIDIKDYDYLLNNYRILDRSVKVDNMEIFYNKENFKLTIKELDNLVYEANISDLANEIIEKQKDDFIENRNRLNPENTTIIKENEKVGVKFIVNSISGRIASEGETIIEDVEFTVLIKIK
ncbi:MAG: DUF4153 domain-containing protein [Tissierellia bacterium]|nr:DUF4153 domain-containing protein [Tissierellia bacterium]